MLLMARLVRPRPMLPTPPAIRPQVKSLEAPLVPLRRTALYHRWPPRPMRRLLLLPPAPGFAVLLCLPLRWWMMLVDVTWAPSDEVCILIGLRCGRSHDPLSLI